MAGIRHSGIARSSSLVSPKLPLPALAGPLASRSVLFGNRELRSQPKGPTSNCEWGPFTFYTPRLPPKKAVVSETDRTYINFNEKENNHEYSVHRDYRLHYF